MSDLSEVLGSLMISLVHARRMADEETAAVAEYYKDHPLLEGMSLPRVRVPELTIDLPVTIDEYIAPKDAAFDTPGNIHKALMNQLKTTLDDEDILSRTGSFQNIFDREVKKKLDRLSEQQKNVQGKVSREAMVRAVDDALQASLAKADIDRELPPEKKQTLTQAIRHRVSSVALKAWPSHSKFKTSAVTSDVKERANHELAVRLNITLREEGLEWSSGQTRDGAVHSRLMPE